MPSSKFNRRPVPRLRPPICIAPAGSCYPTYELNEPPFLQAAIQWWDLDPLYPVGMDGYAVLDKVSSEPRYYGVSRPAPNKVGCEVYPAGPPNRWNVDCFILWQTDPPQTWNFVNVYVDPEVYWDTGLLRRIWIPLQDYQICRIVN